MNIKSINIGIKARVSALLLCLGLSSTQCFSIQVDAAEVPRSGGIAGCEVTMSAGGCSFTYTYSRTDGNPVVSSNGSDDRNESAQGTSEVDCNNCGNTSPMHCISKLEYSYTSEIEFHVNNSITVGAVAIEDSLEVGLAITQGESITHGQECGSGAQNPDSWTTYTGYQKVTKNKTVTLTHNYTCHIHCEKTWPWSSCGCAGTTSDTDGGERTSDAVGSFGHNAGGCTPTPHTCPPDDDDDDQ